jgi:F0F1-type ATP synthase membrane subunit b/b'
MKKIEQFIQQTRQNIEQDRDKANNLLDAIALELFKGPAKHQELGYIAAKYLETSQRSNEQLVKLLQLIIKEQPEEKAEMSEEEIREFYQNNLRDEVTDRDVSKNKKLKDDFVEEQEDEG